jgi:UDP-glucose 4-epimerase
VRIFVTGIAGFLGAHIAREGKARGWDVTGIDSLLGGDKENVPPGIPWRIADCRDPDKYADLIEGADVIYHCAAAPYEGLSVFSPQVVYENTLMSTIGMLRAAANAGVSRFIYCSSMSRYGSQKAPFTEDMPLSPEDPYACAKVASEQAVRLLCGLHGMEWVIVVPHNIYGPGQRYYDPFRNVAGIMINRILQGKPPIIYGDGRQRRCLSYIDDVTDPLLKLVTGDYAGEVFNVGPDHDDNGDDDWVTINSLAHTILYLCDSKLEPEYFPARPAEVFEAHCSADKARKMLDYRPRVELYRGLERYIEWVKEKGPRPFEYHLPVEISNSPLEAPRTWTERLM